MKRLASAVACLVFVVATAPAEAAKRPRPCPATGETRTASSVVYERQVGGGYQKAWIGCHVKNRRRTELTRWTDCGCSIADQDAPTVGLSGRFAVVSASSCDDATPPWSTAPPGPGDCSGSLYVTDLRSGRERKVKFERSVAGLVLTDNGSVAFVDGDRLVKSDRGGTTTLDSGAGIDPSSLAANGSRLYWLHDAQPRVAPFTR